MASERKLGKFLGNCLTNSSQLVIKQKTCSDKRLLALQKAFACGDFSLTLEKTG
jgi:hypothetical protein